MCLVFLVFFFFNDTATTEIYTLSLHDALPISTTFFVPSEFVPCLLSSFLVLQDKFIFLNPTNKNTSILCTFFTEKDRKSTRLNSSHANISYAVFCLKKKKNTLSIHTAYSI